MSFSWSTFALQAVNFLVLVWLLKRFLLKPVTAIVARRRLEISNAMTETEAARQSAEEARRNFELRQSQVETERQTLLDQVRTQLRAEHSKMVEEASAEIEKLRSVALKQVAEEKDKAAQEVFERAVQIGLGLTRRILHQYRVEDVDEASFNQVLDYWDHLPAAECATVLDQFGHDGGQLTVATANALDSERQTKWLTALNERIGKSSPVAFVTDQELIAGVELRFPHATLRFTWRDAIAQAQRELSQT